MRQVRRLDPATGLDETGNWWWNPASGELEAEAAQPATRQIDGQGRLVVGPALCDLYATVGEPGQEQREDLQSLAAAALAGGYTQVALLPHTDPPVDTPAAVEYLRRHFPTGPVEALVLGALSRGAAGEALVEMGELQLAGVAGFTDARPLANWVLLRRFLDYAPILERPVLIWPCLAGLASGVALEGDWQIALGLPGRPAQAETIAVAGLLELVRLTGAAIHLMRLATARSVALVAEARREGLPVTASVAVHHLALTSADLVDYEPTLRFEPPLGNPADRKALLAGLRDGTIDAIASDHTPWTYEEKTLPFTQAPPGAIALELALPLVWQAVEAGEISALRAWDALSSAPRRILAQPERGLVLFDPDKTWVPDASSLKSRSSASHWYGRPLQGRVLEVLTPMS